MTFSQKNKQKQWHLYGHVHFSKVIQLSNDSTSLDASPPCLEHRYGTVSGGCFDRWTAFVWWRQLTISQGTPFLGLNGCRSRSHFFLSLNIGLALVAYHRIAHIYIYIYTKCILYEFIWYKNILPGFWGLYTNMLRPSFAETRHLRFTKAEWNENSEFPMKSATWNSPSWWFFFLWIGESDSKLAKTSCSFVGTYTCRSTRSNKELKFHGWFGGECVIKKTWHILG